MQKNVWNTHKLVMKRYSPVKSIWIPKFWRIFWKSRQIPILLANPFFFIAKGPLPAGFGPLRPGCRQHDVNTPYGYAEQAFPNPTDGMAALPGAEWRPIQWNIIYGKEKALPSKQTAWSTSRMTFGPPSSRTVTVKHFQIPWDNYLTNNGWCPFSMVWWALCAIKLKLTFIASS